MSACADNSAVRSSDLPQSTPPRAAVNLPIAASPQLTQFQFVNENDGWGLTESKIVRTGDGGLTWHETAPPVSAQFGYAPFFVLDSLTAWILIPSDDYLAGTVFRTSDGGSSWTSSAVPFAYASLQFLDARNGFALAALDAGAGSQVVALYHTTDAGANWTRAFTNDPNQFGSNDSLPLGGQKFGFAFLDTERGWVGGSAPRDNYIYLYRTTDGGATWRETNLKLPAGYESAQAGNAGPRFFSASDGILIVNLVLPSEPGLATVVYRTGDAGETWTPGQVIPYGRPAHFFSASGGAAWGGGAFHVTRDAGQTWSRVTPDQDFSALLGSFQFVNPLIGWALTVNEASNSSLYKTADGGATWTLLIP